MSEVNMLSELSNFITVSKYARHLPEEERRETWKEAVDRVEDMHLRKYAHLDQDLLDEIRWSFDMVRDRKVLPSMRSIQYGGLAIEAKNERAFNCSATYLDRARAFSEIFYLLLCGSGVGVSLRKEFVDKLPDLISPEDWNNTPYDYWIADDIEGWADSLEALMNTYFAHTPTSGRRINFIYDLIRGEGSQIKTGGGKAPGPNGLRAAHQRIINLLDSLVASRQKKLEPHIAGDVLCHASDAVLSGGVRRSALSFLFGIDDKDMLTAKIGSWYQENPQRQRANNSIMIKRDDITFEDFKSIVNNTKEFGEPGFVFTNTYTNVLNPCQPSWAPVLTPFGIRRFDDIAVGDKIWSETGWTTVVKKWSTGVKDVFKYSTTAGSFYGTENHKLLSHGIKVPAKDCESIDILSGPRNIQLDKLDPQSIIDGLVLGDGSVHAASNNLVYLHIGENDKDYLDSEVASLIAEHRPGLSESAWEVQTTIHHDELAKTFERVIPDRFIYQDAHTTASFLRGLFSANGSIVRDRITLKTTSSMIRDQVQLMLSSLGIRSYFTTSKTKEVAFDNGNYVCKESYDINVTVDRNRFARLIGFIQNYKNDKLAQTLKVSGYAKSTYDIISVEKISTEEVFDITVDNDTHTYWTNGLNVSNCFEINFVPVYEGESCVAFCNLTSINCAKIKTQDDFLGAVRAATIIGTLQASYTNFKYLSESTRKLAEEEALLGVSMTAMMESFDIAFSPEIQRRGAQLVLETNEQWAKHLGINPAARATCIKPEGSGTLSAGSVANGIHPVHAHKFFRRVQVNRNENHYQFLKQYNPHMCEQSVHNPNGTDDIVIFPIEVDPRTKVKADMGAIEHLELIKLTQQNWVVPGTSPRNTLDVTHNISCTVIVKPNEWDDVVSYLYENRYGFAAVSLLPSSGDKDYLQPPFEAITTVEDETRFKYLLDNYIPVDYSLMHESEDGTSLISEGSCYGGACVLT